MPSRTGLGFLFLLIRNVLGAKVAQLRGISNTIQAIVCNADAIISVPFTLWGGITAAAPPAPGSPGARGQATLGRAGGGRWWSAVTAAAVRLCAGGKGSGCTWRWWKIRPVRGPERHKMADILTLFAQTEKIAISTWHFSIFPLIIQSYILPLQCQVCKSKHVERHFK